MSKAWSGGKIFIRLQDDRYQFEVGALIKGTVRLQQQTWFPGHEL